MPRAPSRLPPLPIVSAHLLSRKPSPSQCRCLVPYRPGEKVSCTPTTPRLRGRKSPVRLCRHAILPSAGLRGGTRFLPRPSLFPWAPRSRRRIGRGESGLPFRAPSAPLQGGLPALCSLRTPPSFPPAAPLSICPSSLPKPLARQPPSPAYLDSHDIAYPAPGVRSRHRPANRRLVALRDRRPSIGSTWRHHPGPLCSLGGTGRTRGSNARKMLL